ncbi:MAG: rhamnogalacturonan lyase [Roseburia sp.]|nr:rhamnogalacturonan lyase [Roseburia sp.]
MRIREITDTSVTIEWEPIAGAERYRVYWADADTPDMAYKRMAEVTDCAYTLNKATHVPHYLKLSWMKSGAEHRLDEVLETPVKKVFHPQLEKLNRGLVAVPTRTGVFLSWRMLVDEVKGYCETGLTGMDYAVYKNGERLALVTDSTNYLDRDGTAADRYQIVPVAGQKELTEAASEPVTAWAHEYLDVPIRKPAGGVTPAGEEYSYSANDMSVADVDGDGEYEFLVKWDPSNAHDVSIKGYTGNCYIDCYRLDGTLLWRLDMGVNIRAGAHYTQFMAYDFNGDGKAELAVKTAPGTRMIQYHSDGTVCAERYITMPEEDLAAGRSHADNYVCSAADYREHMIELFLSWQMHEEVRNGHWPQTLEECFGIDRRYSYPLAREDAEALVDYFINEFAPKRSPKNRLDQFEGFIYQGPEYLTMFAGDGAELETIRFKMGRVDDGLLWGDYALPRIEPCNRVDRFLSGVAYLDGERPYLIVCRGYYTRTTIVAYDFFENAFREKFSVDSGFVPMKNPFNDHEIHDITGTDPIYGRIAGQGNHSLATADVDGDGFMEIIYGGCVIDHDGSVLYSSYDYRPDGVYAKLGHGDAMHVAKIDPDRPGLQIFNVFEGGAAVPYGFALRDAETGEAIFGEYATEDLGRCMIGKIDADTRGLQVWVKETFDCKGNKLDVPLLGTNQSIRYAADLTTQITDGADYVHGKHTGVVNDNLHGVMLEPKDTLTNNGTKGNPCLVADIFGDFREELLLRTADSSAIRIYTNTDITAHKLFTLMHDAQYRCGVAWQNNCYNQPGYTSFYYASDMDFKEVFQKGGFINC